ncbi:MAG: universal stress protein [Proteobacteria bacterium]|nr:universal stress protein [Pseudomonadota bacterium]
MSNKKNILVGIDGSTISDALIDYAIWLANSNGLTIKLVHTIEHSHQIENSHHDGNLTPNIRRELLKELSAEERVINKALISKGKSLIFAAKEKVQAAGLTNVIAKLRHGTLPEAIEDLQAETAFIMLGSKGKSQQQGGKGLGFHLEESIRATNTPVFIAKKQFSPPKKVMFAYNGSTSSKRALDMITQETIYQGCLEIHIVCVKDDKQLAEKLVNEAKFAFKNSNNTIVTQTLSGDTIEQLTTYQQTHNIDITAMGAFSHGKLHGFFFGSFTTKMIQQSETNFLLII